MARSMACGLGTKNIRVNSLSPGYIYTSFVPLNLSMFSLMTKFLCEKDDGGLYRYAAAPSRKVVQSESHGTNWATWRASRCGCMVGKWRVKLLYGQRVRSRCLHLKVVINSSLLASSWVVDIIRGSRERKICFSVKQACCFWKHLEEGECWENKCFFENHHFKMEEYSLTVKAVKTCCVRLWSRLFKMSIRSRGW